MANNKRMAEDVILEKVDSISDRITRIESEMSASRANSGMDAVIRKLGEENAKLKREISFVSAQIEGLFATLSNMIGKMPEKINARVAVAKGDVAEMGYAETAPVAVDLDVEDLAARVASKISVPEQGYSAAATPTSVTLDGTNMDYDTLGYAVAKRIYIPQAIVEQIDYDLLAEKLAEKMPPIAVDYEDLGLSVAKRIYVPQAIAEDVDYDEIAQKVIEKLPELSTIANAVSETAYSSAEPVATQSVHAEIDYDQLVSRIAEAVSVQESISPDYIASKVAEQIILPQTATSADVNLDVEELSRKVADKIVIPAYEHNDVSEERIAEAVYERLHEQDETAAASPLAYEANIDEQALAEGIASRLNFSLSDELIASAVVKNLADAIDSDEIADCVAKRVGTISPEQFEITVDDDGCESLANAVEQKLDYELLASSVAEKLNPAFMATATAEVDADELARAISEKLSVNADVNEDVLADKAAAILSNYMPEIDSADIADKVVAGIIPALPGTPVIDNEGIAYNVSERIMESQEDNDYDIVIDEDGLTRITASISEEITKENEERYQKLEGEIADIKEEYGKRFDKLDEDVADIKGEYGNRFDKLDGDVADIKGEYDNRFDKLDEDIAEIKAMLLSGIVVASTETHMVAQPEGVEEEVVKETDEKEPEQAKPFRYYEEPSEEDDNQADDGEEDNVDNAEEDGNDENVDNVDDQESAVEENDDNADNSQEALDDEEDNEEQLVTVSDIIGDQIDDDDEESDVMSDIDENLSDAEIMPDGIVGGVDFAHMMKYNRSFIARIIQGTDDQKTYYGQVKTALLSYKKVNSNVAWGAERFNKGRETIARFKIRGKTLCLYLALDPKEFEYSVYHHADVSDNKSMHGTPMMVKVKSPLGAKKAIRLIDIMLAKRNGIKHNVPERDYVAMYPYETIEELIEDGLVKDVNKD